MSMWSPSRSFARVVQRAIDAHAVPAGQIAHLKNMPRAHEEEMMARTPSGHAKVAQLGSAYERDPGL